MVAALQHAPSAPLPQPCVSVGPPYICPKDQSANNVYYSKVGVVLCIYKASIPNCSFINSAVRSFVLCASPKAGQRRRATPGASISPEAMKHFHLFQKNC